MYVKRLAAEEQSPAFTLHYTLTNAPSTDRGKEKSEPERDSIFYILCLHQIISLCRQLGNTNSKLYIETMCVCCVCVCVCIYIYIYIYCSVLKNLLTA